MDGRRGRARRLWAVLRLPANQLTMLRLALIPGLWALAFAGRGDLVGPGLMLAALTDVADGIVARTTRTTTAIGSALDSIADHVMGVSTVCFLFILHPQFFRDHALALGGFSVFGLSVLGISYLRHGRIADLHLYSAKTAGVLCYAFVGALFFFDGYSVAFLTLALGMAYVAAAETLVIVLTRRRVDEHVGSVFLRRPVRGS